MSNIIQSARGRRRGSWWALATLGLLGLAACRDDPPSPAGASASATNLTRGKPDGLGGRTARISPEAQKRFRVDVCAFGTLGLLDVRDAYVKSLRGAEPGPKKIPDFGITAGDGPEPAAKGPAKGAEATATATATATASSQPNAPPKLGPSWSVSSTLAFAQALRSCSVAKKLAQPAAPELDGELERYEQFASALHKLVVEAQGYYQAKTYETDGFKRGKELHAELGKAFAELDPRTSALGAAVEAWNKQLPKPSEKLDESGELAQKAMDEARSLTVLLLSKPEPALDAVQQGSDRLKTAVDALDALGAKDPKPVHPQLMVPSLRELLEKATVAQQQLQSKALTPRAVHEVAGCYAGATDAAQRARGRALGARGSKGRPRIEGGGRPPPDMRPIRPVGPRTVEP
jgi:hypothetical protein